MVQSIPIVVPVEIVTLLPIDVPLPITTSGSITVNAPIEIFSPSCAVESTTAVG